MKVMSSPATGLPERLAARIGRRLVGREPMRSWSLSRVERWCFADGSSVVFKHAAAPFTDEARVLDHVAGLGLPVPRVLAAEEGDDTLAMLITDLGPSHREPTLGEAAAAAATVHTAPPLPQAPVLDAVALASLPYSCLASLAELASRGRFVDSADMHDGLRRLAAVGDQRARNAETAPFGLCHSEFHPTSVHIDANGRWRLLDWARAFTGPGLLDLASWHNTTDAPDPTLLRHLIEAYVAAGGPAAATADRGGLPAEQWSIGWHRMWIIDWYLTQATTWIANPASDHAYQRVIRRHLGEARQWLHA